MIYPNAKRYNNKKIVTQHFTFICATFNRREGFAHECTIYAESPTHVKKLSEGLARWYNRSWESFDYETAINDAINKLPDDLKQLATLEIRAWSKGESERLDSMFKSFESSWRSLPAGQRERIADAVGEVTTQEQFESVANGVNMLAAFNSLFNTEDSNNA